MVVGGIGTVLTAGYFLWMLQRVNMGKVSEKWESKKLSDVEPLEIAAWAPLLALIFVLGLYPRLILDTTNPSVVRLSEVFGGAETAQGGAQATASSGRSSEGTLGGEPSDQPSGHMGGGSH
jgi:NADH:ubiquinone oxidoreductase subunit 4 (subunit M)